MTPDLKAVEGGGEDRLLERDLELERQRAAGRVRTIRAIYFRLAFTVFLGAVVAVVYLAAGLAWGLAALLGVSLLVTFLEA